MSVDEATAESWLLRIGGERGAAVGVIVPESAAARFPPSHPSLEGLELVTTRRQDIDAPVFFDAWFRIYRRLWARAEQAGAYVAYGVIEPRGTAGTFWHKTKYPKITIHRPYYVEPDEPHPLRQPGAPLPPPDLVAELFTLAHELGHMISWRRQSIEDPNRWTFYESVRRAFDELTSELGEAATRAAARERLAAGAIDAILDEERRAWDLGAHEAQSVGLTALDDYERAARHSIHCYRYRLGLDELWPEDEADSSIA